MKKIAIKFLAVGLLFLGACDESFLDVQPATEINESTFYRTPSDAEAALVGAYDGLQRVYSVDGIAFPVASTVLSDNAYGGTGNSDAFTYQAIDEFDPNRSPTAQNLYENNWIAYYRAIYRCNVLISKMDQIDWSTAEEGLRNTYEGEARFLRAFLYFDMVRLWGSIPLLSEASSENEPQATPDEVYTLIAGDLKWAADNMQSQPYAAGRATQGRTTKWAAEALLARVYLYYTGYYNKADLVGVVTRDQALAYIEDVIANGGFGLLESFAQLWPAASLEDYAGEDNKEVVFSIKYTYTSDYDGNVDGNHWMVLYGIREMSHYPYGNGWGGATVTRELWNAYPENDTRREASIINIDAEEIPFDKQENQREYTGLYIKKYTPMVNEEGVSTTVPLGAEDFMVGQYQDFFSIRYADVLLMAAELGSPNAQSYFDQVRQRAYGENFTTLAVNQENIMQERRLELAFEGLRYWDLLRQGVDNAAKKIAVSTTVLNGGTTETKTISAGNIVATQGLQQIPNNQITLSNGLLVQNPGW